MGRLKTKAVECQYKGYDRLLTKQFISRLNDYSIIDEIPKVATLQDMKDTMSEHVLWPHRDEVQRAQNQH